eukprot:TRINITY_DN2596_c0_g1_i1.p1 TRINITY_DN2596_c0_g1~~TRINITY_DN2596_c0_g1_i1.p1  ORF type:complete len:523 (+),score=122.15 TRINITY_DN2596_c0_g1_i1:204-1772(+)
MLLPCRAMRVPPALSRTHARRRVTFGARKAFSAGDGLLAELRANMKSAGQTQRPTAPPPAVCSLPPQAAQQQRSEEITAPVDFDPSLGYRPNMLSWCYHRNLRDLLCLADAPHPKQVHEDIRVHHGHTAWSKEDALLLLAHCHMLLRVLKDSASPDPQPAGVDQLPTAAPVPTKEAAAQSLHWAYEHSKQLWVALQRGGASAGHLAATAMLRCTATTGDIETAVSVFEGAAAPDRRARYQDTRLANGLVWTYAEAGQMAECVKIWDLMLRYKATPDVDTYEAMLHCAFRRFEIPTVLQTFREMQRRKVKPRAATYEMAVSGCLDTRFFSHAWMFYYKYKDAGYMPSVPLQMRMGELYSESIQSNAQAGSKIAHPVVPSPHLSYKMIIDFCRVRSIRDVVMPDHVAAPQPHYFAAVDGMDTNTGVDVFLMAPRTVGFRDDPKTYKAFTTHAGHRMHWKGRGIAHFLPPGAERWERSRTRRRRSDTGGGTRTFAATKAPPKLQHDFTGMKGSGPWASQSLGAGF